MIKKLLGGYIILFLIVLFILMLETETDDLTFISLALTELFFGGIYWLLVFALWLLTT